MTAPLKHGPWRLADLAAVPKNGLKVFSCFHCAGGSSMGYKLAGFEVIGGVEIDPKIMAVYRSNHKPKHSYLMGVQDFNALPNANLPAELFDLDVLDGSPPCSTFSMAGSREKAWGKLKMFREGQAVQVLDDLFGHFIMTVNKLRPKVVIAENVKGMLLANAKGYVKEIMHGFEQIGYRVQLFLLNASKMGVPQKRERVFFIANRLGKTLHLHFDEPDISLHAAIADVAPKAPKLVSPVQQRNWHATSPGKIFGGSARQNYKDKVRCHPAKPANTLTASGSIYHWSQPRLFQGLEVNRIQSFPEDFDFCGQNRTYICGMSVPPYMMQRLALEVQRQILDPAKRIGSGMAGVPNAP